MSNKNPYKDKSLSEINQTIKQINKISFDHFSFQPAIKELESITMPLSQIGANEVLQQTVSDLKLQQVNLLKSFREVAGFIPEQLEIFQQLREAMTPLTNYQTNLLKKQIDLIHATTIHSRMNYLNDCGAIPCLDLIQYSVQPFKEISEAYSIQANALRNVKILLDNIPSTKDVVKLSIQNIIGNLESIPSYVIDDSEELSEEIVNSLTELEESVPIETLSNSNAIPLQREEPSLLQRVKSKLVKNGVAIATGLGLILQVYSTFHTPVEIKEMLHFLASINQNLVEIKQANEEYQKHSLENQERIIEIEERRLAIEESKQD